MSASGRGPRQALQRATHVSDVKKIADAATAAEVYAKRQKLSEGAIGLAHALKIEALSKLGQLPNVTKAKRRLWPRLMIDSPQSFIFRREHR